MKTLYYSMINPYLDYGALLWGSASKTNIKPIEYWQKSYPYNYKFVLQHAYKAYL